MALACSLCSWRFTCSLSSYLIISPDASQGVVAGAYASLASRSSSHVYGDGFAK